jgi:L-iditol 2-dehydrogenase
MTSKPATSRAAALVTPGQPLQLIDVPIPDPIEDGAILVRTQVATLCGTDVHVRDGAVQSAGGADAVPLILGHEMVGRIVAFGNGPRTDSLGQPVAEGDRIVWTHGMCGRCRACTIDHEPSLCENRRRYMTEPATRYPYLNGGLSEYGYVYPTSGRVRVPDDVPDAVASASSCALRTVMHGFERLGGIADTDTVVVQGAGPVGLFAVAKAVCEGASRVIVIGGPKARLALAASWGAATVIDVADVTTPEDRVQAVRDLTDGRGGEIVLEMSGIPSAFSEGMGMLRKGGRYLIVGQAHNQQVEFNPSFIMFNQATLIGSLSAGVDHYWKALEFLRNNADRFDWSDMLSGPYPLEQVNDAFDQMASWHDIKPVISFA